MDDDALEALPVEPVEPEPRPRRSFAWLAWLVILGVSGFAISSRYWQAKPATLAEEETTGVLRDLQTRYLLGAREWLPQGMDFGKAVEVLRQGNVESRLRFIVFVGEIRGPADAVKELERLDREMKQHAVKPTAQEARLRSILGRLYGDYQAGRFAAPSVPAADRSELISYFGWLGEVALVPRGLTPAPEQLAPAAGAALALAADRAFEPQRAARQAALEPARSTFVILVGAFILAVVLTLAGFFALVVFIILAVMGMVRSRLNPVPGPGGIYAETFALWLLIYFGLGYAWGLLPVAMPLFLRALINMALSLLVLAWPVLRGIPWSQVRKDLGLHAGRGVWLEPLCGLFCYVAMLPVVAISLILMMVLLQLQSAAGAGDGNPFGPTDFPTHPIVGPLARGGAADFILGVVLASIMAPFMEETMFRGVLYRHLREFTRRFHPFWAMLASAVPVSLVFAVLHPQGLMAVPVLTALALGFALAREWRGSLLASMTGHALNNGMVSLVLYLLVK
jgi:membrane protease YdiL (CAAX protease family)